MLQLKHPEYAQFFLSYFAQGVQRVGKEYLRTTASTVLHGDAAALQLFYNLLPEFGSLPWTLKPVLMFLAERYLAASGRVILAAFVAVATGAAWGFLALADAPSPEALLCTTALVSLGSAVVDGLVDGKVAELSSDTESAAACRYLCEVGSMVGGLVLGAIAWMLDLGQGALLLLAGLAWVAVAPSVFLASTPSAAAAPVVKHGRSASGGGSGSDNGAAAHPAGEAGCGELPSACGLRALVSKKLAIVSALVFVICLAPGLDFFLFRQHRLGLVASQQSLISVVGSLGWFAGASAFRHVIAPGRPIHTSLRICLLLWPWSGLVSTAVSASASAPSAAGAASSWNLALAAAERLTAEFCKAFTFFPSTVLMQMYAPAGLESTAFTLMQSSGTVASVLGRNLEFTLMRLHGVQPSLGPEGFERFASFSAFVFAWRLATVIGLINVIVPWLATAGKVAPVAAEGAAVSDVANKES